jgi:FkbM family methyltransferase
MQTEHVPGKEYLVGRTTLVLPFDHALDQYQRQWNRYDRALGELSRLVWQKYRNFSAIDVGANVGDSAALISAYHDVNTLCVEGTKIFLPFLIENARRIGPQVMVEYAFVGDGTYKSQLTHQPNSRGSAKLVPNETTGVNVPVKTLRSLIAENALFKTPRLIKIDTDGYDFNIINSSVELLSQLKPVLFYEYAPFERPATLNHGVQSFRSLIEAGYRHFVVYDNFGNFLIHLNQDDIEKFIDLNSYLCSNESFGKAVFYFDICAFAENDKDVFRELRRQEIKSACPDGALILNPAIERIRKSISIPHFDRAIPFSLRRLFHSKSSEVLTTLYQVRNQLNSLTEQVKMPTLLHDFQHQLGRLTNQVDQAKILAAQAILSEVRKEKEAIPLAQAEFRVFSQFGDDGIVQYIIGRLNLPVTEHRFVEFGVEDYREANTRFLLLNNNWTGLAMDGSQHYVSCIRNEQIYWRHDLTALARFITRENINSIIEDAGFGGRIGILSIDVDGNDYWIWEAITSVDPAVVIVEYNGIFGSREAVTIPYQADFVRQNAHYSYLYWGASLQALCHLAPRKRYTWIGCNSAGNNAYFVRSEYADLFYHPTLPDDFVAAKFREGRDEQGNLNYIGQEKGLTLIKDLPIWDVVRNQIHLIGDLRALGPVS